MAPNGAAALHLVPAPAPESEDVPARATACGPGAITEVAIGRAVASAVTGLCCALEEYQNGGLRPETRLANGERIAALYTLQQAHAGALGFPVVAREQGRRVLRQYLAEGDFYSQHSAAQGDAVLDVFIDDVLTVVARVTAFEQAWAN